MSPRYRNDDDNTPKDDVHSRVLGIFIQVLKSSEAGATVYAAGGNGLATGNWHHHDLLRSRHNTLQNVCPPIVDNAC